MEKIVVEGIEIEVSRKRIKNLYIRVRPPEGRVYISAPTSMSLPYIRQFATSKIEWILRHRKKYENYPTREALSYVSGETLFFRGKARQLQVIHSNQNSIFITGEKIVIWTKENSTVEQRSRIVDKEFRKILSQDIAGLAEKWQGIIGVKATGFGIRDMKSRWGTCNIKTKKIWLSLRLVHKAPELLEYVVVHELVHLLEKSHNQIFKSYMDMFLPNWRSLKNELNQSPI